MSLVGFKAKNHRQQVARRGADDKANTRITPNTVWSEVQREFGPFTLDVAASAENAKSQMFYDLNSDGLVKHWEGRVWCNPPYSCVASWVKKAVQEAPHCELIVMLVPANRTEQRWWHEFIEPFRDRAGSRLQTRFLFGRLEFGPAAKDGKGNRPPFGCALLIWGSK